MALLRVTDARVEAAWEALRSHDELRRAESVGDAFEVGPDELPVDARGWLNWHDEQYKPAYRDWRAAMTLLQVVMGPEFPGLHPFNFRPVCERIVAAGAS